MDFIQQLSQKKQAINKTEERYFVYSRYFLLLSILALAKDKQTKDSIVDLIGESVNRKDSYGLLFLIAFLNQEKETKESVKSLEGIVNK